MSALLMLSPAPVIETLGREVLLDVDFVEGMKLHCQFWPGRISCVLHRGAKSIPNGKRFSRRKLGFDLILLDPDEPLPAVLIEEANLVYCSADDTRYLQLPKQTNGRLTRLVYTLENAPGPRLAQVLRGRQPGVWRKLRSALGALRDESALRTAIGAADGVQLNGVAAQTAYRRLHGDCLLYLDSRLRTPMLARATDQQARAERLNGGALLKLVHVGPLEQSSGVNDLLQVAYLLKQHNVGFGLELFGEGSLEGRLRDGIAALGLGQEVSLAGSPAFETALVPYLRCEADLLLAPRRQSDPVSVYTEAMGCGVPVLGYANAMWRSLQAASRGGWVCRKGSVSGLVRALIRLDGDRPAIIRASARALEYARGHTFEHVFARRMAHLRDIARLE